MKTIYSKFVEHKVTQYLLTHRMVQRVGKLTARPRKEAGLWKQALHPQIQPAPAFWIR